MRQQAFAPLGRAAAALLCATVLAVACDSPSDPDSREPAAIAVVAGGGQQGTAGQELAVPIAVKVTDDQGRPVAGQVVTFHVTSGGGSVFSGSATTNAQGIAQERWTPGTAAGSAQTLEARVVNGSGATLTAVASATVAAGPVAHLDRVTPLGFAVGVVNSMLDDTLVVRVTDAFGNGVAGVTVNWAATAGGGSTSAPTSVTDANGFARMTWVLGPPPSNGYQSASATVAGMTVSFYARAAVGMLALQPPSGATVSPGEPLVARVAVNDFIGPVPGLTVRWQVTSGGGTVAPATSKTGNDGIATAQWTPGPTPGTQTLTATAGSLSVTFTVNVSPTATRTLLTTVPGQVLDVRSDRVLWLDHSGATPAYKLRTVSSGTDVTIALNPGSPTYNVGGWLFNGGALLRAQDGQIYEWRAGVITPLGYGNGPPSVEGEWAAWGTGDATAVIRRDLSTGTNVVVPFANTTSVDVGANGDVVFLSNVNVPWLYRDGTLSQISTQGDGSVIRVETDGINIVYLKADAFVSHYLWLENGGSDLLLASHGSTAGAAIYYRLNGGWIAWNTPLRAVFRRSPGGAVEQVTTETTALQVVALASDGTLVYEDRSRGRYFLVTPAGVRLDAGPTAGTQYLARGSSIFAIVAGAVYRITA